MEKYNIYCDESCHLEHDGEKVMVIGGVRCLKENRKYVISRILQIKEEFGISKYAEIKWNKVSKCNLEYFKKLVEFFFDADELQFRAVIVDKEKMNHEKFNQTHNEFYYKMYYQCLIGLIDTRAENYIYLDKKDTRGTYKINLVKEIISRKIHDFDQNKIIRMQCVNSSELPILQLADLLIGAIGYHNRNIINGSCAKRELVEYIRGKSGYALDRSTYPSEQKFNLFFIDLQ